MNLPEDFNLFDKIWQISVVFIGAMLSSVLYFKRRYDKHEDEQNTRIRDIELKQVEYNSTVEHILEAQNKMYQELKHLSDKLLRKK